MSLLRSRRSLGTLANGTLALGLLAVALGTAVIWISFANLLDARERLFDRLEPALVQTEKLRTALVDQETGIRGFAQGADLRFLVPYQTGQADETRLTRNLRRLLADAPEAHTALDAVTRQAATWRREVAEPIVSAPTTGPPSSADPVVLRAKLAFDEVRARVDALERVVRSVRRDSRHALDTTTTTLGVAIGVAIAAISGAAFAGTWLLRRRVIAPIERLVEQTDAVDQGRFDTVIDTTGPDEIERLATRVNDMRERIVAELAVTEAAKVELDRRSQSLERSNRDLEQFAYVASHDLQEPLRKVASFCQLLEQRYGDELDDKGRLYISYAADGAKRMQALISDLLDFSRVGRSTAGFVPCDLGQVVAEVVDGYSGPIEATGATVIAGDLPTVAGDRSLLTALFGNLVANALKYRSPDVAPVVRIAAEQRGDMWEFSVTDNGIGIEENFRERVFVIFQRLHGRDAYEGTGIGLALCKKIVEFHGGEIWVDEGPPDGGTVVRWTLPASATNAPQGYDPHEGATVAPPAESAAS
ncbi:MAG: ATP-binding protein [Acidimicrobiales bacterium]